MRRGYMYLLGTLMMISAIWLAFADSMSLGDFGWATYTKSFQNGKRGTMIIRFHYFQRSDLDLQIQELLSVRGEPISDEEVMESPILTPDSKMVNGDRIESDLRGTNYHFSGEMYLIREGVDKSYYAGKFRYTVSDKEGIEVFDSGWRDCFIALSKEK